MVTIFDSNYVLCSEAGYKNFPVSYGLVTAVYTDTSSFAVQYSNFVPGTATKPATTSGTTTKSFSVATLAKIFDYRCHPAKFQDIQVGQYLDLYQSEDNSTIVNGIYIGKDGVATPVRPL